MVTRILAVLFVALATLAGPMHHLAIAADHGGSSTHDAGSVSPNPLTIAPDLAIFTLIIFLVLLAILWKFAWGPIIEGLQKREDHISNEIAAAQQSNQEAKDLLNQYSSKLSTAAEDVRALLEQARRDADVQKQEIIDQAQKSAQAEKDRALREIWAAKNQAMTELAQKSVDTAIGLAGQIVRRQLSTEEHTQLIQDALGKFPSKN